MENLHHPQESGETSDKKAEITSQEAIDRQIPMKSPPPDPVKCEFCGKTLYYTGIVLFGGVFLWSPFPQRCDCEEAAASWKAKEEADAKRKAEAEAEETRKRKQARYDKILGNSGMKKRFIQRTFESFNRDTPEKDYAWRTAKKYADTFDERYENGTGLYIEGTNGTGKTHLAAAISLQLMAEFRTVIFKTSNDLFADIRRAYDDRSDRSEYEIVQAYKSCELLVIDDLGKEQCTEWSMTFLYDILNDRYERMIPTIITTNYGMDDLIKALTPEHHDDTKIKAIISRAKETSVTITMAWADYRGSGGKK